MDTVHDANDGEQCNTNNIIEETEVDINQIADDRSMISESSRRSKRGREEEEDEWSQVKNRRDRIRDSRGLIEISITSRERLPKQFALAKLFKSQNVTNITKVKYINPYKIIVEISGEKNVEHLIQCNHFIELGWRFQRPLEVGLSYGVIKNIELDLSEEDLLKSITCDGQVVNVRRLKRRADGGVGWTDSESVRVGFAGSLLPTHIHIFGMKVKVEPYLFPVTQCSRCWRFGHTIRMCPSKRIYCPKCGGKHENCNATTYKCINCTKNHITLNRNCPEYIKEKKIREIMAEFNVSYRKAVTMYVPPQTPTYEVERSPVRIDLSLSGNTMTATTTPKHSFFAPNVQETPTTYAQAVSCSNETNNNLSSKNTEEKAHLKKREKKKKKKENQTTNLEGESLQNEAMSTDSEDSFSDKSQYNEQRRKNRESRVPFFKLLQRIKAAFYQKNESLKSRIEKIVQLVVEWVITWACQNIINLPLFINPFD